MNVTVNGHNVYLAPNDAKTVQAALTKAGTTLLGSEVFRVNGGSAVLNDEVSEGDEITAQIPQKSVG